MGIGAFHWFITQRRGSRKTSPKNIIWSLKRRPSELLWGTVFEGLRVQYTEKSRIYGRSIRRGCSLGKLNSCLFFLVNMSRNYTPLPGPQGIQKFSERSSLNMSGKNKIL